MDRSQLVCAKCQWKYPLPTRVDHFEGQSLEAVACPQCHALALQVLSAAERFKRFRAPARQPVRDTNS